MKCPLLRSTFFETLRLVDRGWKGEGTGSGEIAFPERFDAERFLSKSPSYLTSTSTESTCQDESKNESLRKSYLFLQNTTLALVAGILIFWDIEPAPTEKNSGPGSGWKVPEKVWMGEGGIAVPANDLRVRIKRRKFVWME